MRSWHLNIPYITEESAKGNVWSSRWVRLSLSLECSRSSPLPESRLCHSLKCHSEQHIQGVIMIMWDLIQNKLYIMDWCDTKSSIRRISTLRNVMQHSIFFAMLKLIIKLFAILSISPGLMLSLSDALKDEHRSSPHEFRQKVQKVPQHIISLCVGCILSPASPAHITHLGLRVPHWRAMTWMCGVNWLGQAAGGFTKVSLVSLRHTSSPCYMTHELINLHLNTSATFSTGLNDTLYQPMCWHSTHRRW